MAAASAGGPAGFDDANLLAVANYLFQHGYSKAAAAGIAGDIAGESGGNPESAGSGGDGLIGWTPPSTGPRLTGNSAADLKTQEAAIIAYNKRANNGAIGRLNAMTNPVQAADFYSQNFERPLVTNSDVRPSVANWVFSQISGTGGTGGAATSSGSSSSDPFANIAQDLVGGILKSIGISSLSDFFERAGLVLLGLIFILFGIIKITGNDPVQQAKNLTGGGSKKKSSSKKSDEYSDKPYKSEAGRRQYEEYQDRETEKAYNKRLRTAKEDIEHGPGPATEMPEEIPF